MATRNIIIGDVHGCLNELKSLLEKVQYTPRYDRLIFVGDIVDRGPNSVETIQFVRELAEKHKVVSVMGNHEEKYVRYRNWQLKVQETGKIIPMNFPVTKKEIFSKLSETDHNWLQSNPYYYHSNGFLVVHGGVCKRRHLKLEDLDKKKYKSRLLMLRKIDPDGKMRSINSPPEENDRYWSADYDGRFDTVIYGHDPGTDVRIFAYAFGIDTGCCFGGKLTALIYHNKKEPQLFSVKAKATYCSQWEIEE